MQIILIQQRIGAILHDSPKQLLITEDACLEIALVYAGSLMPSLISNNILSPVPTEVLIEKFCQAKYKKLFDNGIQNFNYYEFTKLSNLREYATIGELHRSK